MTDIYANGTFSHEIDLFAKVETALLDAGWSAHATLIDGYDKVFYSTGEDGYAINYLRVAAQQGDDYHENTGFRQRRDADGYTGFLNFFTYQYFPSWGTSTLDGYGEAGIYGPVMYHACKDSGNTVVGEVLKYNLATSTALDPRVVESKNPIGIWPTSDDAGTGSTAGSAKFDGTKNLYISGYTASLGTGTTSSFDVSRSITTDIHVISGSPSYNMKGCTYIEELDAIAFLNLTNITSSVQNGYLQLYDYNDQLIEVRNITPPPWATSSLANESVGYGRYFYAMRGSSTATIARYDVLTDTWLTITLTGGTNLSGGGNMTFVTREQTGLPNHRLYYFNSTTHLYVNIEDNGSIIDSSWTSAAAIPFNSSTKQPGYEWDGYNNIFYSAGAGGSTKKELYKYSLSGNAFSIVSSNFKSGIIPDVTTEMHLHYGKQSRVRAQFSKLQKYWAFANKDRLSIVTKDGSGFYTYCYAGAVDSYSDATVKATTTSSVTSGISVVVPVTNTNRFLIGEKVQIQTADPANSFSVTGLDERVRKFINTENTTITDIDPGVSITLATLNGNYNAGAIIATDIQNTMLSVEGLRCVQALNKPNISNSFASGDPVEQTYFCEPAINTSVLDETNSRTDAVALWPFVVFGDSESSYSGRDFRGQLKGVFATNSGAGVSEDIVEINGQQYIIFEMSRNEDTYLHVFGPII